MKLKPSSAIQSFLLILILHATTANLFSQGISVGFSTSQYMGGYNVSCRYSHDGYIKITNITGGTPPYTYIWNTGQTTDSIGGKYAGIYTLFVTDSTNTTTAAYARLFAPNALTVTLSNTLHNGVDISVYGGNNGNLNSTVNGGNGSYYWNWSNGSSTQNIDNLTAGTYSVTVTDDNGCSTTSYKTLTQPNPLHVDTLSGPLHHGYGVSCNGGNNGAVNLAVSGGVPPYNYNWSGGSFTEDPDNFAAGTYTVHITDDNGAELDTFIVLTQPSPISYDVYTTAVSCHYCTDGIVRAEVSGGVSPYAFQWFNSDDSLISTNDTTGGLASGDYTFVFTDANGCTSAGGPLTIEAPAYVALGGVGVEPHNALCHGGSSGYISFSNGGGTPPYHYQWSSGGTTQNASNLVAGTYTVLVIDSRNDSLQSDVITVGQPTNPISISLDAATYCYDTIICYNVSTRGGSNGNIYPTVNGGTPSYYYSWSNGSTSLNLLNVTAGTYSLTVTDDNGCTMSNSVSLTQPAPFVVSATQELQGSHHLTCADGNDGILVVKWKGGIPEYDFDVHDYSYESELAVLDEFQQNDTVYLRATGFHAGNFHLTVKDAYNVVILDSTFVFTAPDTIKPNYHKSVYPNTYNVGCYNCSNGKITATPTGGTPPYSIEWLDSEGAPLATGDSLPHLHAGDYYYVLTDANGCNAESEMITLTRPDYEEPFHVTVTPHQYIGNYHVSCNGVTDGKIRAVITGGSAPYTYSWNNGASTRNLTSAALGSYFVTVTDSGSVHTVVSDTVLLENEPGELSLYFNHPEGGYDITIHGESTGIAAAEVSGGTLPYLYSWSTGATTMNVTGLPAGTYTLVVADMNGCDISDSDPLIEPDELIITSLNLQDFSGYTMRCNGGSGTLHISKVGGIPPYHMLYNGRDLAGWMVAGNDDFLLETFETPIAPTNRGDTVLISLLDDYGARVDTEVVLTEPDSIHVSILLSDVGNFNVSSMGAADGSINLTVTGGFPPYSYSWYNGITNSYLGGEDYIDSLEAGLYTISISDQNGCGGYHERWLTQPNSAWSINGNSNIWDTANYLGTTTGSDLKIKTNGQERMRFGAYGDISIPALAALSSDSSRSANGGNSILYVDGNGVLKVDGGIGSDPGNGPGPGPAPCTVPRTWMKGINPVRDVVLCGSERVGIGTYQPQEAFQIGDRWTFHNGGTKIIGNNFHYNGTDARLVSGFASEIRLDAYGNIEFVVAPSGSANSTIIPSGQLSLANNGTVTISSLANYGDVLVKANNSGELSTTPLLSAGIGLWNKLNANDINSSLSGNIGIGTTTPNEKLDVNGNIRINDNALYLRGGADINHGLGYDLLHKIASSITSTMPYINGPVLFGYEGGALGSNTTGSDITGTGKNIALYWNSAGKVGIGTINLNCSTCNDYNLFVTKGIRTEKVKVDWSAQNGWADYVFKDDYKLKSIYDLEIFIKKNKHLPGMPTEEEVKKNGVDLGEMQVKLLEKVEELTLYVLELKKENDQVKNMINKISK